MSNDLIAIPTTAAVPAHLAKLALGVGGNSELTGHAGAGFPVMSIKGKAFTLVRGDEATLLMNPNDPDAPASSIEVVLLKANPKNSKTFYLKGYVEGADGMPDCMSSNGIAPDPASPAPQSKSCASCKHNEWGSKVSEDGRKSRACQDNVRVAIAAPDQLNDPMLLRVPPATIRPLAEYGSALEKRGVPYYAVVTKVGFDATQATPKLTFKAVSYINETQFAQAQQMRDGDLVAKIIGTDVTPADDALPAGDPPAHVTAQADPEPAPAPKAEAPAAKPTAARTVKKATTMAAAPTPAPVVQATSAAVVSGVEAAAAAALSEVDELLSQLDG